MLGKYNKYWFVSLIIIAVFGLFFVFPQIWDKPASWISKEIHIQIPPFPSRPFRLGLDLAGGTHLVYKGDLSSIPPDERKEAMESLRNVIERRVNLFGVSEPRVQVAHVGNDWRLIVELAGVKDIKKAIQMIGRTPYLEFKEVGKAEFRSPEETKAILEAHKKGQRLDEDPFFKYAKKTGLDGRYLKKANVEIDQTTLEPRVDLEFDSKGAEIFSKITEKNVGKHIAIYLDGSPISWPVVREKITGGKAQISGNFTIKEAKNLAQRLNAGALPVPITLISQYSIGASLGRNSLNKSLLAGILGVILILLFMILYYRSLGFFADLALIFYFIVVLGIFKGLPVTMTLAGIAGFILSIGMAVDANVLIFERMKEERKKGLKGKKLISEGFSRAWPSIRDGNATTILVSIILFYLTSSIIKGFALTLLIGVLLSMFSAVMVTRILLEKFGNH